MNQQSKMLTPPIDETVRSLRKIAPLALAALVLQRRFAIKGP